MVGDEDQIPPDGQVEPRPQRRGVGQVEAGDPVETGVAGHMHTPGFFTHAVQPAGKHRIGNKMDMRRLGHRVAHLLVKRAFCDFTAGDVRERDAARNHRPEHTEQLVAITGD